MRERKLLQSDFSYFSLSSGSFLWEKEPEQDWCHGGLWGRGPPCSQGSAPHQAWSRHRVPSPVSLWPVLSGNDPDRLPRFPGWGSLGIFMLKGTGQTKVGSGMFGRREHVGTEKFIMKQGQVNYLFPMILGHSCHTTPMMPPRSIIPIVVSPIFELQTIPPILLQGIWLTSSV